MSTRVVHIVEDAEADLNDIYDYIVRRESPRRALHVLDKLEALCLSLGKISRRGHVPPELEPLGMTRYREVHFKPYRVIYEVAGKYVYVHAVLDGRRSVQTLLERRLLRP